MLKKFWGSVSYAGISKNDTSFNGRRQVIFNQLVFLAVASCIIRLAVVSFFNVRDFSLLSFIINILPVGVCVLIFRLNTANRYRIARHITFFVLPLSFWLIAYTQEDYSIASLFAVFGMLAFFFLESDTELVSSYILCALCFLTLKISEFQLPEGHAMLPEMVLMLFNNLLVVGVLFLLLSFIRRVLFSYQQKLADGTARLSEHNKELKMRHLEIMEKNALLEEKQASLSQANRHNNKVFSVISHDLRTPIVSVKNIFDLYEKGILSEAGMLEYMPELSREMGGVIDLLENLLQWARLNKNGELRQQETVPVFPVVNEIIGIYTLTAKNKGIQLHNQTARSFTLTADRNMIKAVLRNLVSNALKFTAAGGTVGISTHVTETEVYINVQDNGRGMLPEDIQRIMAGSEFTSHGTLGEAGSGMGLSLCRDFLTRNNGRLEVSSTPGAGSIFSMVLPLSLVNGSPATAPHREDNVLRVAKIA